MSNEKLHLKQVRSYHSHVVDINLCMKPGTEQGQDICLSFVWFGVFWEWGGETVIERDLFFLCLLASRHSMEVSLADVEKLAIKLLCSLGCWHLQSSQMSINWTVALRTNQWCINSLCFLVYGKAVAYSLLLLESELQILNRHYLSFIDNMFWLYSGTLGKLYTYIHTFNTHAYSYDWLSIYTLKWLS